jgi:hypothetical protein
LWESLATSAGSEISVEAEGLHDGEVGLDGEHRRADTLLLAEDLATTLVEARINAADSVLRALDFD